MSNPFSLESVSNDDLYDMVAEAIEWDETAVLPDGKLRALAAQWKGMPGDPGAQGNSLARTLILTEAAKRWLHARPFAQ